MNDKNVLFPAKEDEFDKILQELTLSRTEHNIIAIIKEIKNFSGLLERPTTQAQTEPEAPLNQQLLLLAIQVFRRGQISQGRLRETCELVGIEYEQVMPVAMIGAKFYS